MTHFLQKARKYSDTTHQKSNPSLYWAAITPDRASSEKSILPEVGLKKSGQECDCSERKTGSVELSDDDYESKSISSLWDIDFSELEDSEV
jgi:hypothetical protein